MSVSDRVKLIRESLGKSQKEMSKLTGISYRTWQNYEDGVNAPGWDACAALVKMGFNANWLLSGEGKMRFDGGITSGTQPLSDEEINAGVEFVVQLVKGKLKGKTPEEIEAFIIEASELFNRGEWRKNKT